MGRIQACVGLGFVLGPATMTVLHKAFRVSTADTFFAAAAFPLVGMLYAVLRMPETKPGATGVSQLLRPPARGHPSPPGSPRDAHGPGRSGGPTPRRASSLVDGRGPRRGKQAARHHEAGGRGGRALPGEGTPGDARQDPRADGAAAAPGEPGAVVAGGVGGEGEGRAAGGGSGAGEELIPRAVMLLVGNGFLLMYAFSIETIYAVFLKVGGLWAERARVWVPAPEVLRRPPCLSPPPERCSSRGLVDAGFIGPLRSPVESWVFRRYPVWLLSP